MLAELFAFSNIIADALGGLAVVIITYISGAWMSGRQEKKEKKAKEELTANEKLDALIEKTDAMHTALVGAEPSPLNPFPAPGLTTIVPELLRRTTKIEHTLFTNGGANNTIVDRLSRMEVAQVTNQSTTDNIEQQQSNQETARAERNHE